MMFAAIIFISIAMLVLFFAVTIAGGKAHDRANAEAARRRDNGEPQDGR